MQSNEIVLPFVTITNIKKPRVIDSLDEMYDFIVPFVNDGNGRPFHLYFQADVNVERLHEMSRTESLRLACDALNSYINEFVASRNGEIKLSSLNSTTPFVAEAVLDIILFKMPFRKTVMGSYPCEDGKSLPTINLKLPRGTMMFISAVCNYPDESINNNSIGTVNIFGYNCLFFFKKNTCNINRHISHTTMQKEFEKAMKESFSYLEQIGTDNLPWNSKLVFA